MMRLCLVWVIYCLTLPCGISYARLVGVTTNTTKYQKDLASRLLSWEKIENSRDDNSFDNSLPERGGRKLQFRGRSSSSSDWSCPLDFEQFRTTILITQTGDLGDLDYGDVAYLGELFEWRYNVKNKEFCDPSYRRIRQTRIVPSGTEKLYDRTVPRDIFRIQYEVEGYCSGCITGNGFPLFGGESSTESGGTQTRPWSSYSSDDACECNSANPPRRGPTEMEVVNSVNGAISIDETGTSNIDDMFEIMEVKSYPCAEERDFRSLVVISLNGDLLSINDAEQEALEATTRITYNELSLSFCALPYLHSIKRARLLDIEVSIYPLGIVSQLQFELTGKCHGCSFDESIFSRDLGGLGQDGDDIIDEEGSETCFCPAGTPLFRAPTEDEMQEKLTENLLEVKTEDFLSGVVDVRSVVEVIEVQCGPEEEFSDVVFTEIEGEPVSISENELANVGDSVLEIFNQETFTGCDGYFRQMTGSKILLDEERIKQQKRRRAQRGGSGFASVPSVFEVVGSCRNCPLTTPTSISGSFSLFDDASGRNLQQQRALSSVDWPFLSQSVAISYRRVQQGGDCLCPVGSIPRFDAGPTKPELLNSLNNRLGTLNENGLVENVAKVVVSPVRVRCSEKVTILNDVFELQYDFIGSRDPLRRSEDDFVESFLGAYEFKQSILCDPFRRKITSFSCNPTLFSRERGSMRCNAEFECRGPCDDWIVPGVSGASAIFDSPSFEYEIFNCPCLDASARAPSAEEVLGAIALEVTSLNVPTFLNFSFIDNSKTEFVERSAKTIRFTMDFVNYYYHFHVSQEEYDGMVVQVALFFFDYLSQFYDGSNGVAELVYFIPSINFVQTNYKTIRMDFVTLVEYIGGDTIPLAREVAFLMARANFNDFINDYVRNADPLEENIFHSTISVRLISRGV